MAVYNVVIETDRFDELTTEDRVECLRIELEAGECHGVVVGVAVAGQGDGAGHQPASLG